MTLIAVSGGAHPGAPSALHTRPFTEQDTGQHDFNPEIPAATPAFAHPPCAIAPSRLPLAER